MAGRICCCWSRSGSKSANRADGAVIFEAAGDLGREIVTRLEIRGELYALADAWTVKGSIERRVKGPIPASFLLVDDRPDFPGPCVRRKNATLIPDFCRKAHPNGPLPSLRHAHPWANMIADPLPALTGRGAGENIPAGFEPIGKAVSDFQRLVPLVLGWVYPINHGLGALNGEVAVQLDHGVVGLDGIGAINLNFVVPLCEEREGEEPE